MMQTDDGRDIILHLTHEARGIPMGLQYPDMPTKCESEQSCCRCPAGGVSPKWGSSCWIFASILRFRGNETG
jgi:hypothetical protein